MRLCTITLSLALLVVIYAPGGAFSQCQLPDKTTLLIMRDAGTSRDTVFFGHHPLASHGRDTIFCESELPPMPPPGVLELRFVNPPGYEGIQPPAGMGQGFYYDFRHQSSPTQIDTHRVRFQPGPGDYPITFSWSPSQLLATCDSAWLLDEFGGMFFRARMHADTSLVVTNPAITTLLLYKFGTVETPAAPTLLSPPNGATGQPSSVVLEWNASPGAATYHLQVATDSGFAVPVLNQSGLAATSLQTGSLLAGQTYYWRVNAANNSGASGWSETWSFTVLSAPSIPILLLPADQASNQPLELALQWNSSVAATWYRVQFGVDSVFGSPLLDDSLSGTSRSVTHLATGATYFWRVRAGNSGGVSGWSPIWRFTTQSAITRLYPFRNGWNMLSLPLAVDDPRVTTIFPSAASGAFAFGSAGYVQRDSLRNGTGYWLKLAAQETTAITGRPVLTDTVVLVEGWNLIGSISAPVDSADIVQEPPGILASPFYGYDGGYTVAESLLPAHAYWVKASSAGRLILHSQMQPAQPLRSRL